MRKASESELIEVLSRLDTESRRLYDCYPADGENIYTCDLMAKASWLTEAQFKSLRRRLIAKGLVTIGCGRKGQNRLVSFTNKQQTVTATKVPTTMEVAQPSVKGIDSATRTDRPLPDLVQSDCSSVHVEESREYQFLLLMTRFKHELELLQLGLLSDGTGDSTSQRLLDALRDLVNRITSSQGDAFHLLNRRSQHNG